MIYIYALVCPLTGKPRYVGKCKNMAARLRAHVSKARVNQTKHHCSNWIRLLLSKGLAPSIISVSELPDGSDWQAAEKEAIKAYRAAGFDLTNITGGGDGFHDMPPESLARRGRSRSRWAKVPKNKAKVSAAMRVSHARPEVRVKISNGVSAAWENPTMRSKMLASMRTPEAVRRRSEASKKPFTDSEYAARHKLKMKNLYSAPERKEEARQRSLKAWADPEITRRRLSSMRATKNTPEYKAKQSAASVEINARPAVKAVKSRKAKLRWADPETRARMASAVNREKMSASAKARWARVHSA